MKTFVKKKLKKNFYSKVYLKKLFACTPKECPLFYLEKDGTYINTSKSYLLNYYQLLQLLHNTLSYSYIRFPLLYGRHEADILDKISILNQCVQEKVVFYIEKDIPNSNKKSFELEDIYQKHGLIHLVFLKHSHMEPFVKVLFYNQCEKGEIKDIKINPKNIQEQLGYYYFTQSLMTYEKPKDEIISVQLFYTFYIYLIRDELIEKYNIDIRNTDIIANYKKLYMLLDKLGYVKRFYKTLYPKAKLLSTKLEKKLINHPKYIELLKYFNSYKPFEDKVLYDIQDIDIKRLIQVHVEKPLDQSYILAQYKRIQENRNFGIRF